jgi:hypothetical protein
MTWFLLAKFALSTAMLLICVATHGIGLFGLTQALRTERNIERLENITALSFRGAVFTFLVVLLLIAVHGIEIWAYALLYLSIGAVSGLEEAIYYSTISYSTVGYHDEHMAPDWKLLGAFESIVGMIMIGWSTAFLFRILGRIDPH